MVPCALHSHIILTRVTILKRKEARLRVIHSILTRALEMRLSAAHQGGGGRARPFQLQLQEKSSEAGAYDRIYQPGGFVKRARANPSKASTRDNCRKPKEDMSID